MSTHTIEFAGGVTLPDVNASRRGILARAPAWWRALAARNGATMPVPEPQSPASNAPPAWHYGGEASAKSARRHCGWLSGCVSPSVAVPCFNHADKLTMREQFTSACWERVLEQSRRGTTPIVLRHGHEGSIIASTSDITLTFDVDPICGLLFDAKLSDDPLGRSIIKAAATTGLAVSIAYKRGKGWTVEREGGTVRVIDECIVDHVAVLPEAKSPAYRGARCYGELTSHLAPPSDLRSRARVYAWREIKREAGVMQ
jgi:hypothetical protein